MKVSSRMALWICLAATPLLLRCGSAVPAAAPTDAPLGDLVGDAARGEQAFRGTCSACHGADARGLPHLGKDLTTSEFVRSQTDADLIAFVKKGRLSSDAANTTGMNMPPKGGNPALTDQDLADIVAFVRTLEQ
jgi:mono/diheme cytochrome c family protein